MKSMRAQLIRNSGRAAAAAMALTLAVNPSWAKASTPTPEPNSTDGVTADELSDRAIEQFELRQFDAAIAFFEQAYALDRDPNYLFNIGRVHEEKGDFAKAIELYESFIAAPGVELEARDAALDRLAVLRRMQDEVEPARSSEATEPAEMTEPSEATEPSEPSTSATPEPTPTDTSDRRSWARPTRIAGYSLLGLGGAALGVGVVFGVLAVQATDKARQATFVDVERQWLEDGRTWARAADITWIAGGVTAAVGLALVLATLSPRKRPRSKTARHTGPWLRADRQSFGLGVTGNF